MKNLIALAVIALVAGISSVICARLEIPVWVMFIGWIAFVAGGGSARTALPAYVSAVLGLLLGFIGAISIAQLSEVLGSDLPVLAGVFLIVFAALLAQRLRFANLVICYFIGMTTFFASGLAPAVTTGLLLAAGLLAGIGSGLAAVTLATWIERTEPKPDATGSAPAETTT